MKITPREKGEGELARFARSTVPEEKWGLLVVYHQSSPHIIEGGRFFRNEERVLRKGGILVFFLIFFYPAHRVSPYVSGFRVLGAQGLALLNMHSLHAYIYPRIFGFYHTFGDRDYNAVPCTFSYLHYLCIKFPTATRLYLNRFVTTFRFFIKSPEEGWLVRPKYRKNSSLRRRRKR